MTEPGSRPALHASLVSVERLNGSRAGILITGPSGSGKSSLALRLIDDSVTLAWRDGGLWGSPHPKTAGLIEARGIGLIRFPHEDEVRIALAADLVAQGEEERLPPKRWFEPPSAFRARGGALRIPLYRIWAHDPAAAAKLRMAALGTVETA
jgi:HPr kinase/phosphorylase